MDYDDFRIQWLEMQKYGIDNALIYGVKRGSRH
jgi:hypothetical protein